jgi:hypothetical protein
MPVGGGAKALHEILSREPHGRRIEDERALSGEPDDASLWILWILWIQLLGFLVMQIADFARASVSPSK